MGTGAAVRIFSALVLAGSLVLTAAVLVRMLGQSAYGVLAFGLAAVGLASAFTSLGLGPAVTKTVAERSASGDVVGASDIAHGLEAWVLVGGAAGFLAIVILFVATQTQLGMDQRLTIGAGLGMLLVGRTAAAAAQAFALGSGRLVLMDIPTLFSNLLQLLAALALFALGTRTAEAVAIVFGAVGLLTVALSWWVLRRVAARDRAKRRDRSTAIVRLVKIAAPYAVAGVMLQVIANFDVLVLGLTHLSRVVGRYEPVVLGVARMMAFVAVLLMVAYLPAATRLASQGHRIAFADLYLAVSRVRYVLAWPFVMLLAVAPVAVFRLVFGRGFLASATVVNVLLVGYVVDLVMGLNGQALVASGERRKLVLATLWPLLAMVILSVLLIPPFGAVGAAAATAGAIVVLNLSMSWTLFRSTRILPFDRDLTLVVLTSPLPLGLALVLRPAFGVGVLAAAAAVGLGWALWIGLLRVLSALRLQDVRRFMPGGGQRAAGPG